MHITVSGKHIDIGDTLRTQVADKLDDAVEKYFDSPVDGNVVFSRDGHEFRCDATVHLSTGLTAKAHGSNDDIYSALDQAAERIAKQMRRYKRRLKDHHQRRPHPVEQIDAQTFVLAAGDDDEDAASEAEMANGHQPAIIAEMTTNIHRLSVGEAVMHMELAHAPFLMFTNESTGRINLVFQRDDGNVGWIDPANAANA